MGDEVTAGIDKHVGGTNVVMRYFRFAHLPQHLQVHSRPWAALAVHVCETIAPSPERTVALRKLLEGKDAAVRAALTD